MIKQSIEADLKQAMLAGDKELTTTLRTIKSVILDAEISSGAREKGLGEDEIIVLLQKESKKRLDAATMYKDANEQTRADKEIKESEIIKAYLPEMMSEEEITAIAKDIISSMDGNIGMQQMGPIIGQVKARAGSSAEGSVVAKVVKDLIGS